MKFLNLLIFIVIIVPSIVYSNKDIQVIIPATEIDGEAHLFYKDAVNGRISMKFDGGVFNKIGAGLFLKEN
jgi:hypothetical protein